MSEIISEDDFKKAGSWEKWVKKPIGSGPYKIVSFKTSNRLELFRNDQYWGDKGAAQKVSFVEVPELSARVAGLRSGEFDIITEVPPDQIKPLSSDGKVNVIGGPIANVYGMVFDTQSSDRGSPWQSPISKAMNCFATFSLTMKFQEAWET